MAGAGGATSWCSCRGRRARRLLSRALSRTRLGGRLLASRLVRSALWLVVGRGPKLVLLSGTHLSVSQSLHSTGGDQHHASRARSGSGPVLVLLRRIQSLLSLCR